MVDDRVYCLDADWIKYLHTTRFAQFEWNLLSQMVHVGAFRAYTLILHRYKIISNLLISMSDVTEIKLQVIHFIE